MNSTVTGFERFCLVFGYIVGTIVEGLLSMSMQPGSRDWWFWTAFTMANFAVVMYIYHLIRNRK